MPGSPTVDLTFFISSSCSPDPNLFLRCDDHAAMPARDALRLEPRCCAAEHRGSARHAEAQEQNPGVHIRASDRNSAERNVLSHQEPLLPGNSPPDIVV